MHAGGPYWRSLTEQRHHDVYALGCKGGFGRWRELTTPALRTTCTQTELGCAAMMKADGKSMPVAFTGGASLRGGGGNTAIHTCLYSTHTTGL